MGTKFLNIITCMMMASATAVSHAEPDSKVVTSSEGNVVETDSTSINFEEARIEGQFKAPQGFFLQGKSAQSLSQMVRLRSQFRKELKDSVTDVNAIAH